MDITREKLETAFAKVLTKHREADPLTLAEKLVERLEFLMEDADGGSDIRPVRVVDDQREVAAPKSKARPIQEKADAKAPPIPAASLITEFDEAEYRNVVDKADPRLRGAEKPKPAPRVSRVASLGTRNEPAGGIDYWTVEELIKALGEQTPKEFLFTPNGCDSSMKVLAVRNIQPIIMSQGPSVVRLEYSNPGVSDDRSTMDTAGQLDEVVLGLKASKVVTLDQSDLNIEAVMDEIEMSLKGLYAPRSSQSEPLGRDPGPIEGMFNMNDPKRRTPMGDSYKILGEAGWRQASYGSVLQEVINTNKRYGN